MDKSFWKVGHRPTLYAAFLYFDLAFMVWVLLGPLGVQIAKDLGLTHAQKGMMVATPVLAGAILRLFMGGLVDTVISRLMDLIMSVPSLVLAIVVIAIIGPSLTNTIVAVTIVYMPRYVRIVRATAQGEMAKDYVTASRAAGVGPLRLALVTVLPNCMAPLIVQAALGISDAILEAAALGFLGLGAQPPTPEWGAMVSSGRDVILDQWWVATIPGLAIFIVSLGFNLLGDGLRDVFDPKSS